MANIFYGLNIGRSGMLAHQTALDVTGHNLANVNTEGYSRQRVHLAPGMPTITSQGSIGSGVEAEDVQRVQVSYLERQIARATVGRGHDRVLAQGLDEVQAVLDEPSESGLNTALTELWSSFDALAARPQDLALRAQVLDRAQNLATVYNQKVSGLVELRERFDEAVEEALADVNTAIQELGDLNAAVAKAEAAGHQANDLRDQRDGVIREISGKMGVEVETDGSYLNLRVAGGGPYLVYEAEGFEVKATRDGSGLLASFHVGSAPISPEEGEIGAYLELRDQVVSGLQEGLSRWMATVTDRINALHRKGTDRDGNAGRNLFVWDGDTTRVEVAPSTGVSKVTAGTGLEPGTHRMDVSVPTAPTSLFSSADRGTGAADSGIALQATGGTYQGDATIGLDYHVRVTATAGSTVSVALYRGDERVGEAVEVSSSGGTASWTVDGVDFEAAVEEGTYSVGDRSDGLLTTGSVSLDGGPAQDVDLTRDASVTLVGGVGLGFLPGGTAEVFFGGGPFSGGTFTAFAPDAELELDPKVAADTDRIAAGLESAAGDGETARRIADLAAQNLFEDVGETPAGYLGRIVQDLGATARDARVFDRASQAVLTQLEAQREAVSGVNMDEEMVQLLQYQRGFEAAARFVNVMDSLIDTLINRVGLAGR